MKITDNESFQWNVLVEFKDYAWQLVEQSTGFETDLLSEFVNNDNFKIEVIGNKFENPELLK